MKTYKSILLLTITSMLCINGEIIFQDQCKPSNNCYCTPAPNYARYEILCSERNPSLAITIKPRSRDVIIDCMAQVDWEFQSLPSIELGNIKYLEIKECPFPENGVSEILTKLGINSTNIFEFSNSVHVKNAILTSRILEGINNLKELGINNNDLESIDKNAFSSLTELTTLELKFNNINLTAGLFNNLKKLKTLDLSGNGISDLPPGSFENLEHLKELYLRANNITDIKGDAFKNLSNLNLLELSCNKLSDLPEDIFSDLINLKQLSLSGNELMSLPEGLFMNTKSIVNIYLYRNPNLVLPNNLFAGLPKLENLKLNECKIRNLPGKLFDPSNNVRKINLNNNEIEEIPSYIFKDLKQLESLDISYNQLKDLPDEIFTETANLTDLNLANNLLTQIRRKFFNNLSKLEILNLENNHIRIIETYSFQGIRNLKEIFLSNNHIDLSNQVVAPFSSNKHLEKIDLSHNNVTIITADLAQTLLELKELDLSYNQISYIQFNDMLTSSFPISIDLSYNQITTIDFSNAIEENEENLNEDPSKNGGRTINLIGNPIICNCHLYEFVEFMDLRRNSKIKSLLNIDLSNLNCTSPEKYSDFPINNLKLDMLTCSPQELGVSVEVPDNCTSYEFRPWDKFLIVDCKEANLTEVPILTLPDSDKYEDVEVHLEGNHLISGPSEDLGYDNVTRLYLSSNNIQEISWIPENIKILELHNNNISHVSNDVLSFLNASSFTNLTLGNNPWDCNCSVAELTSFLTASNVALKQIDSNNVTCKSDGKHIINLKTQDVCIDNNNNRLAGIIAAAAVFTALIIALVCLYGMFKHQIKVWLYAHRIFLWFVQEEELDKDKKFDAFISYSHKDEEFITKQLHPALESGPDSYKLCLHIRDWIAGEFISKQIVDSIINSRRTIVILSRDYLESDWGKMEFRFAHEQALKEGRARVILVLYGDIDLNKDLDEEFKAYIKTNTYLKWGDPWFWDKLRYALPHKHNSNRRKHKNLLVAIRKRFGRIRDGRHLLQSAPTTPIPASTPPVLSLDPLELKKNPLDFVMVEV